MFVWPSHELRLQSVAAPAVVLECEEIQLHGQIWNKKLILGLGLKKFEVQLKSRKEGSYYFFLPKTLG